MSQRPFFLINKIFLPWITTPPAAFILLPMNDFFSYQKWINTYKTVSKYLTDKTIIFGEGERFTGVLYLLHETSADDVVSFYRINMRDDGWSEIAIVRSDFILMNFDKEDRFATIKVDRKFLDSSSSEITIGPKTDTTINRNLNIDSGNSTESEEPFTIQ